MDKVKLERIRNRLWESTSAAIFSREARVVISDIIDALLEEPKPVATEIMDKRTRMKKLILEMLEIV